MSYGKIHLWLLPNLDNEKLGIIDSFKPFYSIEQKKKSGKKFQNLFAHMTGVVVDRLLVSYYKISGHPT